ncbi:MAG: hypothetical protein B6D44_16280 [Ignavibacteriales bacterium UTCHB2]|jgi:hypothetical protein|nr:MAG: hypothetical protein B6D44_16280 [Ignavibacteriales bacterium UTCHB2]
MRNQFANIKKLMLLGFAVVSTKVMLLLFAYFFNSETYNHFNQIYYTASIVILFGSLGFNIAVTRINVSMWLLTFAVVLTTSIAYLFLQILSSPFENGIEIFSILLYCTFISITGIRVFQILFSGKYRDYVLLTLLYSILHLLIIPAIIFFNVSLFALLPAIAVLWFIIGYPKFIKQTGSTEAGFKEFYKIGISAFVINSAVSLALAADKYFVNHFFPIEIANAYTFSWSLTAPMFYIGVVIEQYLFSESNKSKSNILKRGFLLNVVLVVFYAVIASLIINFFPGIIPSSVEYKMVLKIFSFMLIGYSVYVAAHFPINAYLFKSLGVGKQKRISIFFTIIIVIYIAVYILILREIISIDYISLLLITWSYIFALLITKALIMFGGKEVDPSYNNLMELKNLEP